MVQRRKGYCPPKKNYSPSLREKVCKISVYALVLLFKEVFYQIPSTFSTCKFLAYESLLESTKISQWVAVICGRYQRCWSLCWPTSPLVGALPREAIPRQFPRPRFGWPCPWDGAAHRGQRPVRGLRGVHLLRAAAEAEAVRLDRQLRTGRVQAVAWWWPTPRATWESP